MPKLQNPPQAGEKRLCQSLFLTMLLAVISAVAVIYSTVIIYKPSFIELTASLEEYPKMCTTLKKEGNLTGGDNCRGWTSCEEWCLSTSDLSCHHVWAAVRDLGTTIWWNGCDFREEGSFVNHTCNTLEDVESWNCKLYKDEKDKDGRPGDKDNCTKLDGDIIYCEKGICKNMSKVYACSYQSKLKDIEMANGGRGECNCALCDEDALAKKNLSAVKFYTECDETVNFCYGGNEEAWNDTVTAQCSRTGCHTCKDICHHKKLCFSMHSRKDPTEIGTDEFGNSVLNYYECKNGYCSEIYNLTCERRCNEKTFKTEGINSVMFIEEHLIMAHCNRRSTVNMSSLDEGNTRSDTLMVHCTNVTFDVEDGTMASQDCVNGTWFEDSFNGGQTNYSHLTKAYWAVRDDKNRRVHGIHYEQDLIIFNETQLRINIQGCVNNLQMDCMKFYHQYARDGRNYTARAVYPCHYDKNKPDFVVINFKPDETLLLLILYVSIPCGIMVVSCGYMCLLSKFIRVADDGHMRLRCCGKYVTGIGNVPKWDPPHRKELLVKPETADT